MNAGMKVHLVAIHGDIDSVGDTGTLAVVINGQDAEIDGLELITEGT